MEVVKMEEENLVVDFVANVAKIPGVKVNRQEFLAKMFADKIQPVQLAQLFEKGPQAFYSEKDLQKLAEKRVKVITATSATISFMMGIPGGFAIAATIPADISQFYALSLRLAQEVAYIYGCKDLWESGELTEEASHTLMLYLGVMLGVSGSGALLRAIMPNVGKEIGKNIMKKPLTKGTIYPIMKKLVPYLTGKQLTKKGLSQFVSKSLPVVGGVISGGITVATMLPMGNKLCQELAKSIHYSEEDYIKDLEIIAEFEEISE